VTLDVRGRKKKSKKNKATHLKNYPSCERWITWPPFCHVFFCSTACPPGTYKPEGSPGGVSTCISCPDENHTSPPGSTSIEDCTCQEGYRAVGQTCEGKSFIPGTRIPLECTVQCWDNFVSCVCTVKDMSNSMQDFLCHSKTAKVPRCKSSWKWK